MTPLITTFHLIIIVGIYTMLMIIILGLLISKLIYKIKKARKPKVETYHYYVVIYKRHPKNADNKQLLKEFGSCTHTAIQKQTNFVNN